VFFSFTFGGEALSLAAAQATMQKLQREPVIAHLRTQGEKIMAGLSALISKHGADDFLEVAGHPTWSFLLIKDTPQVSMWELKTLFLQEMFQRGILTLATHNMSYSHSDSDIARLLQVYDEVLPMLVEGCKPTALKALLRCKPLEPLFKVR